MAYQDFTTYTEVDPSSHISKTTRRITFTSFNRNEAAYVYKDFGAAYFAGNFVHFYKLNLSTLNSGFFGCIWAVANTINAVNDMAVGAEAYLHVLLSLYAGTDISLQVQEQGQAYSTRIALAWSTYANTDLFLSIERDESIGANGTLYLYVYSDANRSTLLGSTSKALAAKTDFQYLYGLQSYNDGFSFVATGYLEDLDIDADISPSVTTQPCTSITGTTATGHGTIEDLGISAVTQHGHCWATAVDPTTADSKTTNGVGALGAFTSSITGLSAGQQYYVRAYATNGAGTSYGGNVAIIGGIPSSQLEPNQVAVGTTTLLYTGTDGKRYYVQGVAY